MQRSDPLWNDKQGEGVQEEEFAVFGQELVLVCGWSAFERVELVLPGALELAEEVVELDSVPVDVFGDVRLEVRWGRNAVFGEDMEEHLLEKTLGQRRDSSAPGPRGRTSVDICEPYRSA